MKNAAGVDDDCLASHRIAPAHRHNHLGAIILVGGLLQDRVRGGTLDLLGSEIGGGARPFQEARRHAVDPRLRLRGEMIGLGVRQTASRTAFGCATGVN